MVPLPLPRRLALRYEGFTLNAVKGTFSVGGILPFLFRGTVRLLALFPCVSRPCSAALSRFLRPVVLTGKRAFPRLCPCS